MTNAELALYQPLIVGLGAVVLGLVANTLLEWFRHSLAIRHQRTVVRRALLAELSFSLQTLESNLGSLRNDPPTVGQILHMPVREDYPAYNRALDSLGLLTGAEVAAVIEAYEYLHSWPEIFVMIGQLQRNEGRLYANVSSDHLETLILALNDRVRVVGAAIASVTKHLRSK